MKLPNTKKLLLLLLTITAALCLAFGLSACDGNSGTNTYSNYEFDENGHWLVNAENGEEVAYESHTLVNGVCTTCGVILEGSENLEYSFYGEDLEYTVRGIGTCTDTDIIIPSFYNGYPVVNIYMQAFSGCTSVTSVTIGNGITYIAKAFSDCTSLASISIPDSVIMIYSGAFDNTALYNDESNWKDGALYVDNCLITVDENISGSYTVKEGTRLIADEAFSGCHSLTAITISDSVTAIGSFAFYSCDSLESIKIGNNVTYIGMYAFSDTAYYNNAENWENGVLYMGEYLIVAESSLSGDYTVKDGTKIIAYTAFSDCSSLTSITIPSSVAAIASAAFNGCDSLTNVYITDLTAWCNINFGHYSANPLYIAGNLYLNGELVEDLVIPSNVTTIKSYAFCYCTSIKSVTIPDSVISVDLYAFANCTSLANVKTGDNVARIGNYAFYGCTSLTSVTISNGVKTIGIYAFAWCTSLTSVVISNEVKTISIGAFGGCYSLVEIYNLSSLEITAGSLDNGGIAYYAINVYTATSGESHLIKQGDYTFIYDDDNNYYLVSYTGTETEITLPELTVNGKNVNYEINQYVFNGNSTIKSVVIGDSVTSIGSSAFNYCTSLTSIIIPESVTSVGGYAFSNCHSLTSVYYTGTASEWNNISGVTDSYIDYYGATVYYYAENGSTTEAGNYWYYDTDGSIKTWSVE